MSNTDLRMPPPEATTDAAQEARPQEESQAIRRLIAQFDDWRELNDENEQVAQSLLDQAYQFHHGYGLEREIELLELTVEEALQCRTLVVACQNQRLMGNRNYDVSKLPRPSVNSSVGVRATRELTVKRRMLDAAREHALLDAAARLDRLLRKGVEPSQLLKGPLPADRPTLSWRIAEAGNVQPFILGLKETAGYLNAERKTSPSAAKMKGEAGYGPAGHWRSDVGIHAGEEQGPPAKAATSKVG